MYYIIPFITCVFILINVYFSIDFLKSILEQKIAQNV